MKILPLIAVTIAPLFSNIARADVRYRVTDLGDLGQSQQHWAYPYAVNNIGQVAGESFTGTGVRKGFYWSAASGMIDVIPPGEPGTRPEGDAFGINDAAQVVGFARADQFASARAFVWSASSGLQTLGTLGGNESHANAINNAGQVVGESITAEGADHAFIWSAATGMQDLGTLADLSQAYAINDHAEVAGWTGTPAGRDRAFIWSAANGMVELGTLGGRHSYAYGINNVGQVIGEAATAEGDGNQHGHAFLWSASSGMLDLGTLGGTSSVAYGINDSGWVVGNAYDSDNTLQPFVYDGFSVRNLNDLIDPSSGWRLSLARDINDMGQIIATGGSAAEPWQHGFLLTPMPEPSCPYFCFTIVICSRWLPRRFGKVSARFRLGRVSACTPE